MFWKFLLALENHKEARGMAAFANMLFCLFVVFLGVAWLGINRFALPTLDAMLWGMLVSAIVDIMGNFVIFFPWTKKFPRRVEGEIL